MKFYACGSTYDQKGEISILYHSRRENDAGIGLTKMGAEDFARTREPCAFFDPNIGVRIDFASPRDIWMQTTVSLNSYHQVCVPTFADALNFIRENHPKFELPEGYRVEVD